MRPPSPSPGCISATVTPPPLPQPHSGQPARPCVDEFHYSSIKAEDAAQPLFHARDARGTDLGAMGTVRGSVMGSFLHIVDRAE